MAIDLQQVINSPITVHFIAAVTRFIPPAIGYPLCDRIGSWAASQRRSSITRAVRLNQWIARGTGLDRDTLDRVVQETLQNNIRDLFDLYHNIDRPETIRKRICPNPVVEELIQRPEFAGRGLVIAGLHLSGFDSVMQSICRQGLKPLILTLPNPKGGRRVEFELRKRIGMNLVPASVSALREAVRHLNRGGLVLTGIDRPVPESKLCPRFFGQPAALPTHHVYLALKAQVPVLVIAAIRQNDGQYQVLTSEPVEMERHTNHETGMLQNAERVLERAEPMIRQAPQQWNVPLPIWPHHMNQVPD
jgi:KDO2-lipid IV(A) lauroyltransferase